jgi:hypothetical protein
MAYFVSGLFQTLGALVLLGTHEIFEYPSTLANSTLIMLKFSNLFNYCVEMARVLRYSFFNNIFCVCSALALKHFSS